MINFLLYYYIPTSMTSIYRYSKYIIYSFLFFFRDSTHTDHFFTFLPTVKIFSMQVYHLNHINNKLIIQFFTYFYVDIFVNQHNVLTTHALINI